MPYDDITREAYDRAMQLDLPEDREPTREVQKKLDSIEHYLSEKEKEQAEADKAAVQQANKQAEQHKEQPKAEVKFYRNKQN
jgi:molybdopterin-biosynthesis enzyme MoeA-like protein